MLKMYSASDHPGSSATYWDETWLEGDLANASRFCELDPVRPVIDRYVTGRSKLLEGGCGHGSYVGYYHARGVVAVGLDFASDTLERVRRADPALRLAVGDVTQLPFRGGVFDVYYSGGVVEHLVGGPHTAIEEALRVLAPSGTLLISVPYLSPLRRLLAPFRKAEWRPAEREMAEEDPTNLNFVQYCYTPKEFVSRLHKAHFRVVGRRGYAVVWGLQDVGLLRKLLVALSGGLSGSSDGSSATTGLSGSPAHAQGESRRDSRLKALIKRLAVIEDETVPVLGVGLNALRWFCSNMMLYICVPDTSEPDVSD